MSRKFVLLTVLLAVGCSGEAGGGGGSAVAIDTTQLRALAVPAEFQTGKALFEANCSACHGNAGVGTTQGPPLMHAYYEPNHHSDDAFLMAVMRGVAPHHWRFGSMPPVANLTTIDVDEIIGYVRWLQRQAGVY